MHSRYCSLRKYLDNTSTFSFISKPVLMIKCRFVIHMEIYVSSVESAHNLPHLDTLFQKYETIVQVKILVLNGRWNINFLRIFWNRSSFKKWHYVISVAKFMLVCKCLYFWLLLLFKQTGIIKFFALFSSIIFKF